MTTISSTVSQISFYDVTALWKAYKRRWVKPSTYSVYVQITEKKYPAVRWQYRSGRTIRRVNPVFCRRTSGTRPIDPQHSGCLDDSEMILRFGEKLSALPNFIYEIHFPTTAMQNTNIPVLSTTDQRRLLNYLKENFSFRNLGLLICLYSGLRIGEVCGLQWKDLDVATGEIHVTKTVQRIWLSDGDEKEYRLSAGQPTPWFGR